MRKIIISLVAGSVVLIVGVIVGQLLQLLIPTIKIEYQNPYLFRSWTDPIMSFVFIEPFILSVFLLWIWGMTKILFKSDRWFYNGLFFGFMYWLITIPGMIMSYSSFPVSLMLICSWSITILFQALFAGVIFFKNG
jgi:hypothetical protein